MNLINKNMKITKLLIISLFFTFLACQQKQELRNDINKMNLNDKVKSIKENTFEVFDRFGKLKKGEKINYNYYTVFDEKGNIKETIEYTLYGNTNMKIKYKYDKIGNLTEINSYKQDDNLIEKSIYKYDKKIKKAKINVYKSNGELKYSRVYNYDKQGRKIKKNKKGKVIEDGYKYDKKGNVIKDGCKYDEKGNVITGIYKEVDIKEKSVSINKYKYKYDNSDNWTKRVGYEDNIPKIITERKIEYYK